MSKRENASISFAMSSSVTFAIFVASLVYLTTELMHFRDSLSRHVLNKGGLDFCQIRTDLHPPFSHQYQFGYWFPIWVVKISVFWSKLTCSKEIIVFCELSIILENRVFQKLEVFKILHHYLLFSLNSIYSERITKVEKKSANLFLHYIFKGQ